MKKLALIISIWLLSTISIFAQIINVDSLSKDATEIIIPKCHTLSSSFEDKGFNNLRKVTFEGINFLPGVTIKGLPNLEEVVFNGDNLNIGGAQYVDIPKYLRGRGLCCRLRRLLHHQTGKQTCCLNLLR